MERTLVCIGGGRGLSQILKASTKDVKVGICGSTDKGGFSGEAVESLGGLRCMGDVTRGIAALADSRWTEALNMRFHDGRLENIALRHVMFLSLLKQYEGSLDETLEAMCEWCGTGPHRMLSMTSDNVDLITRCVRVGQVDQNQFIDFKDEHELDTFSKRVDNWPMLKVKHLSLTGRAMIGDRPREAIVKAQRIAFAPGSFHGSILATLLPEGVKEAFKDSKAQLYFFLNLTKTESDPTRDWNARDFVDAIEAAVGKPMDHIICCDYSLPEVKKALKSRRGFPIDLQSLQASETSAGRSVRSRIAKLPLLLETQEGLVHDPAIIGEIFK